MVGAHGLEPWRTDDLVDSAIPPPRGPEDYAPGAEISRPNGADGKHRFDLVAFEKIKLDASSPYLIKGLIPRVGLVVVWGPPKCGKSFWTFDLAMYVALGWEYRPQSWSRGYPIRRRAGAGRP
jgi:AAA domain